MLLKVKDNFDVQLCFLVNADLTPCIEMNNADECNILTKKNAEIVQFIHTNMPTTIKKKWVISWKLILVKDYIFSFAISLSSKPERNSSLFYSFLWSTVYFPCALVPCSPPNWDISKFGLGLKYERKKEKKVCRETFLPKTESLEFRINCFFLPEIILSVWLTASFIIHIQL